jgi:hypothetical protein
MLERDAAGGRDSLLAARSDVQGRVRPGRAEGNLRSWFPFLRGQISRKFCKALRQCLQHQLLAHRQRHIPLAYSAQAMDKKVSALSAL